MPKITDYKEKLKILSEQLKQQEMDVYAGKEDLLPSIPDPFGVAVEQDTGITEAKVFITRFSENDVNDFLYFFSKIIPVQHRYDLESFLREILADWCYDHPGDCPYEPFLWALKMTDNYIGSLQNNAIPQPWIVEAVGNALSSVWDDKNRQFMHVLQNVLNSWDWYQPVHAMLCLYQCLNDVNDEKIDKCIREQWLNRALYSTAAFHCLCKKKKTSENIHVLMRFVSQDIQKDINMVEIQITRKMREEMITYLQNATEEEYALAKTFYTDSLFNCSKRARGNFDLVFHTTGPDDPVKKFICEWKACHTESEKRALKRKLHNLFQKDADNVIVQIAVSELSDLIGEVLNLVEQQGIEFETQFWVKAIVKNANVCIEYYDFIIRKFEECGSEIIDDKSFIYGCAFCQLGHPELLNKLFTAIYLQSVGLKNGGYIFLDLRTGYSKQFNEQIANITNLCLTDMNAAFTLIMSCSKIYNAKNVTLYPVAYDKVCNMLLGQVIKENENAARYASALMDLYERIVIVSNRGRYGESLQKIAVGTHNLALESARNRATKLIISVYGAL